MHWCRDKQMIRDLDLLCFITNTQHSSLVYQIMYLRHLNALTSFIKYDFEVKVTLVDAPRLAIPKRSTLPVWPRTNSPTSSCAIPEFNSPSVVFYLFFIMGVKNRRK